MYSRYIINLAYWNLTDISRRVSAFADAYWLNKLDV